MDKKLTERVKNLNELRTQARELQLLAREVVQMTQVKS